MKYKILIALMSVAGLLCTEGNASDLKMKNGNVLKDVTISREANGWFKVKYSAGIGRFHVSEFVPEDQARLLPRQADTPKPPPQSVQPTSEPVKQAVAAPQPALNLLADTLKTMSDQVIKDLQTKGIRRLAVSKVYFNGSGVNPVAQYVQRKLLGEILNQAPNDLTVLEREDMRLLIKENQLQWMVGNGTENIADESEALLMGEFLYDKAFGQALLSLRVIDSKSAAVISAVAAVVDVDPDLSNRFGIPFNALSRVSLYQMQPRIASDSRFISKLKDCGNLSLSPVSAVPQKYQFAVRVFYGFAVTEIVNAGVPVLERELLYQIADERALVEKSLDSVTMAGAIIQTIVDESSSDSAPSFFVKAVRRDGGALLAQVEVGLITAAATSVNQATSSAGVSPLGADDSLASAVRAYQDAASVTQPEALRFQESIAMSDRMSWPEEKVRTLLNKTVFTWRFSRGMDMDNWHLSGFPKGQVNGPQMYEGYLQQIIPYEQGNLEALKASLVAIAVSGCNQPRDNRLLYIGPLNIIYGQLASRYTVNNSREPCDQYWYECLSSFAEKHFTGMHPTLRQDDRSPIDPFRGSFKWSQWERSPVIQFNYTVETTWQGKYPAVTTVILDFSPMKDRLYKIKGSEE